MPRPHAPRVFVVAAILALAGAAVATLTSPAPVRAHEMDPHLRTVVDQVIPSPPPGVTISVRPTVIASEMLVENTTPTDVQVLTDRGRTFLRIGPEGVLGDLDTPEWYQSNDPYGNVDIPTRAQNPAAPPLWGRASHEPSWGWFEHRMHPVPALNLPPPPPNGVQTISRWIVPLRIGTTDYKVLGHVAYVTFKGGFNAVLTSTSTPFPGVTVSVAPGRLPGVYLQNLGTEAVTVTGRQGEPFLRVGPDGVEANLHSPSWVDDQRNHGNSPTVDADASAPPEWQKIHPEPRMLWLETRGFYAKEIPPTNVINRTTPTVLLRWSVPLTQGTATAQLTGTTSYVPQASALAPATGAAPSDDSFPWVGLVIWIVLLGVGGSGLTLWLRARRARQATPARAAVAGERRRR